MAGESEFSERRARYAHPWREGWFYLSARRDPGSLATWIPWGGRPEVAPESVRRLDLKPGPDEVADAAVPALVAELPALEVLSLPVGMVPALGDRPPPPSTRLLMVTHAPEHQTALRGRKLRWPDLVLPDVEGLFFGPEGTEALWPKLGIAADHLPGLEYLRSDVDAAGKVLEQLDRFGGLRMAELFNLRDHDPFPHLPPTLTDLALNGTGKRFSFSGIVRLEALVTLQVVNMRGELDCEVLRGLERLREASVRGPGRFQNTAALSQLAGVKLIGFET